MIRSMTGFARGSVEALGWVVSVELRSLNGRFAEVRIRSTDSLAPLESKFRKEVLGTVRRGRVEVDVRLGRQSGTARSLALDMDVARDVLSAARSLQQDTELAIGGSLDVATVLRIPGVMRTVAEPEQLEPVQAAALEALRQALDGLEAERSREGESLRADLLGRFERMLELARSIRSKSELLPEAVRERLHERIGTLLTDVGIDPARFAQEAALLADRADITEELVRLEGHLGQASSLLSDPDGEPVGKRLDFLLQEIHRETNTIGAKSPDLDLTRLGLDLKSETEKVREQVQNLE